MFELGMYPLYALGIIVILFLVVNILFPKFTWRIFQSWKATKEPSKVYFWGQRLMALFLLIVILAGIYSVMNVGR